MKIGFLLIVLAGLSTLFFHYENKDEKPLEPQMKVLSWTPRVFVFPQFLSEAECNHLIERARPELTRSTVVDANSEEGVIHQIRTSKGMFLPPDHHDPIIENIEKRISALTLIPEENGEAIQVLHYLEGGEYQPHHDYFDPETIGGAAHHSRGGQRVASFLMYLNTPEEGGETVFPILDIKVQPVKGDALLFFDCTPDGKEDPLTLHGGAPVIKGEKWLATRWLRQYKFE